MELEKQAEIARVMTGSKLSDNDLFQGVKGVTTIKKGIVCPKVHQMIGIHNLPFDKAFPLVKEGFGKLASEHNIDSAVLFWIYMEWLNANNQ